MQNSKWITIKKLSELIGYSVFSINKKRQRGIWVEGIHWRKAPDNRVLMNLEAIYKWVEGK